MATKGVLVHIELFPVTLAFLMRSARSLPSTLLLALAACASCASTAPHAALPNHSRDPSAPRCPGDSSLGCLTVPNCQYDETKGCQLCVCSPVTQTPEQVNVAPFTPP